MTQHSLPALCALALAAPLLSTPLAAQIPDGAHVFSALKVPTVWPGDSGVFVANPRRPGQLEAVTDLPDAITYASDNAPGAFGANCVLHDPATGGVIVGINGRAGQDIDLFRVTLQGLAATQVTTYRLGLLVANGGGVFEMDFVDADTVVLALGAIGGPAGTPARAQICTVDLAGGTVTPLDLGGFSSPGFINALAYDAGADALYFGVGGLPGGISEIYTRSLAGTATPSLLATLTGAVRNLAVDADGSLLAGLGVAPGGADPSLVRIDGSGAVAGLLTGHDNVNAFAIEPTTGEIAIAGQDDRTDTSRYGQYLFQLASGATAAQPLALTRAGTGVPAGALSGADAARSPVAYGDPSGSADYRWSDDRHPQFLAVAGNRFRAAVDWPTGERPVLAAYSLSTAAASVQLGAIELLIAPSGWLGAGSLVPDPRTRQSVLRERLDASLAGQTVYAQTFQMSHSGISASDGLRIAIQ